MFSVRMRCDSGTKPRPTWLTRNAGLSVHSTGSRVMRRPSAIMASVTHGAVLRPGMISTSRISGTGLKKCMPPTRSGCLQADAIAVIGIDEVLDASDGVGADQLLELGEQRLLGVEPLQDGLDDDVGLADLRHVLRHDDAVDGGLGVRLRHAALLDRPLSVLAM